MAIDKWKVKKNYINQNKYIINIVYLDKQLLEKKLFGLKLLRRFLGTVIVLRENGQSHRIQIAYKKF